MPEDATPPDAPAPQTELEEWCQAFCPTLPARFESVVIEWNLSATHQAHVRDILLQHVRQSVAT